MRGLLYLFTVLGVIALAAWAYRENHLTQQAMTARSALEREIAALEQALAIQRAEWAYLNRPDRLRDLVELNFDRLQLVPISPDNFGEIGRVAYPMPVRGTIAEVVESSGAVELRATLDEGETP